MKKTLSAAFVVAALALTSACGGSDSGSSSRPTTTEVKKALTSKDSVFGSALPDAAADCVASALVDSKVSNKTLEAIVDGDKKYEGTDKDKAALSDVTTKIGECATTAAK